MINGGTLDKTKYLLIVSRYKRHKNLYYLHDAPILSDYDFDVLHELVSLIESKHEDWTDGYRYSDKVGPIIDD